VAVLFRSLKKLLPWNTKENHILTLLLDGCCAAEPVARSLNFTSPLDKFSAVANETDFALRFRFGIHYYGTRVSKNRRV